MNSMRVLFAVWLVLLIAASDASMGRRMLGKDDNPGKGRKFGLRKNYTGGARGFINDLDRNFTGKLDRIMKNSRIDDREKLIQDLDHDDDMVGDTWTKCCQLVPRSTNARLALCLPVTVFGCHERRELEQHDNPLCSSRCPCLVSYLQQPCSSPGFSLHSWR